MLKLAGVEYVAIGDIKVAEGRQRREIDIEADGLAASVARNGVLTPIMLHRDRTLVYGERRLTAAKAAGLDSIPAVFVEDLPKAQQEIIELTENLKRSALAWRDEVRAIARLHALLTEDAKSRGETWNNTRSCESIGITPDRMTVILRVAEDLENPKIADATNVRAAYNVLARGDSRALAEMMNELTEGAAVLLQSTPQSTPSTPFNEPVGAAASPASAAGEEGGSADAPNTSVQTSSSPSPKPSLPILLMDFHEWAATYTGPKFNFLHCDFPYGVSVFNGPQAGGAGWSSTGGKEAYDDSADVYWKLIETLCANRDRLLSSSAHIMFWLSADAERVAATIARFRELAPELIFNPFPLIWHKTDNAGVLPDPKRGPRRTYEAALMASRGDRLIVKAVANAYGAPTQREHHPSTKPEPVLRHFFSMFVDEHTKMLDPTCGGGSALRAAESMGAAAVLGLEHDPEFYASATTAMRQFRALRGVR